MSRSVPIFLALMFCTTVAHGAGQPPSCRFKSPGSPTYGEPVDLSGKLPAADYLDTTTECRRPYAPGQPSRPPLPRSPWLEADAKAYSQLLARAKYDWLVIPTQIQYYGFDFIERSLISAEVADAVADQAKFPDPILVARALGEVRRRFDPVDLDALTQDVGAKRRIEIFAGHDGARRMTLTLQFKECTAKGNCRLLKQRDWRNLAFSDTEPPFRAVALLRNEIRKELLGVTKPLAQPSGLVKPTAAWTGTTPAALVRTPNSAGPLTSALIAFITPKYDVVASERLGVMALREWLREPSTADSRFHASNLAQDLHRRPFARKLLEGSSDPQAAGARELLNGNLPDAQARLKQVTAPFPRLMLEIGTKWLAVKYRREFTEEAGLVSKALGSSATAWEELVDRGRREGDLRKPGNPLQLKVLLDEFFPVAGLEISRVLASGDLDVANLKHVRQALRQLDPADCCGPNSANRGRWQIYWLLEAAANSNVQTLLWKRTLFQRMPDAALEDIKRFEALLAGEPTFEFARYIAIRSDAELRGMDKYTEESRRLQDLIAYWAQGQTNGSNSAVWIGDYMNVYADAYAREFPMRPYWQLTQWIESANKRWGCTALEYSTSDGEAVAWCLDQTPEADRAKLLEQVAGRFHGNEAVWKILQANTAPRAVDPADEIARARAVVREDPTSWERTLALATLLVRRGGNYTEAHKVLVEYPPFKLKASSQGTVALSNRSMDAGNLFYWQGQAAFARTFYQIAADLDTGSEASLISAARLAQLDRDYERSADLFLQRANRYGSTYGFRDYLSLLYVTGHREAAYSAFRRLANAFDNPQPWIAALVGQRMQVMDYEALKSWILLDEIRAARYHGRRFAASYAIMWATTDRKPPADFPQLVEKIEVDAKRRLSFGATLPLAIHRPSTSDDGFDAIIDRSRNWKGSGAQLKEGQAVKSEYVLLADALTSFHAGDQPAAVAKFAALADLYPIDSDYTKVALPYFAYAAAKTGDKFGVEEFVGTIENPAEDFDVWLARAFFAAVKHQPDAAIKALNSASYVRPYTDYRPIMVEYQYAEACELVWKETKDLRAKKLLLEWAKNHQAIQPTHAWAYAIEAEYTTIEADATRALALTLYLDPQSPRIRKFDAQRIAAAKAWLARNNPFVKPKGPLKPRKADDMPT
jgi:hypothetical protein